MTATPKLLAFFGRYPRKCWCACGKRDDEVEAVIVQGGTFGPMPFWYCAESIAQDRRNYFNVEVVTEQIA